jgi:hypothetical protein
MRKTWQGAALLSAFVVSIGCGSSESGTSHDGGAEADAPSDGGVRTLTTRALLPTAVNNLLLDPFITSDTSWGHFRTVVPEVDPEKNGGDCPYLARELLSASPIGISAPTVLANPTVLPPSAGCTAILAPFSGSTETVHAEIWVSLRDAAGNPVPFAPTSAGKSALERYVTVALVPNSLPGSAALPSYPLEPTAGASVTLAGRPWGQLALSAPVALPEGGWFAITLKNPDASVYLAAPEVVPTTVGTGLPLRSRPMTDAERGAIVQYGRPRTPQPAPRRRTRPPRFR